MINSARIINFQSHKDTLLEFSPGINAIIGDSDKGKTGILRALLWNMTNRPSGLALASDWIQTAKGAIKSGEETAVEIVTDSCPEGITRARRADFNGYRVPEGTLEAVRTDVPSEIKEAFNVDDVNIQRQMDAPFLLSYSPPEAARFINKLIKLDTIDQSMSNIEGKKRTTKQSLNNLTEQLESAENQLESLAWVEKFSELVEQAEELDKTRRELFDEIAHYQNDLKEYQVLQDKIEKLEGPLDQLERLMTSIDMTQKGLTALSKKVNEGRTDLNNWGSALEKRQECLAEIERMEPIVEGLLGLSDIGPLEESCTMLDGELKNYRLHSRVLARVKDVDEAESLLNEARETLQEKEKLGKEAGELRNSLQSFIRSMRQLRNLRKVIAESESQLPEKCPTCGQYCQGENHEQ